MSFYKTVNLGQTERPSYRLVKAISNNIEIRKYLTTMSDIKKISNNATQRSSPEMFSKLFDYIKENDKRKAPKAHLNVNFEKDIVESKTPVKSNMDYFAPIDKISSENKNNSIKVESEMTVAVIRFGGEPTTQNFLHHRNVLIKTLGEYAKNYDKVNIITAHFDRSYRFANEVWLRKVN